MEGQPCEFWDAPAASGQPAQFAGQVQQLLGPDCDLDPLFLEESWTVGVSAAVASFQRRQQARVERERQSHAFRELDGFAAINFLQLKERPTKSLLADRAGAVASSYGAGRPQSARASAPHATDRPAPASTPPAWTPPSWTPRHWSPLDRTSHSWIPQGWSPLDENPQAPQPDEPCADPGDPGRQAFQPIQPLTPSLARQLLGVAADSAPEQIRSAYRRMVGQWHPDRLQFMTEEVRQIATDRMAEINAAYRLLRNSCQSAFAGSGGPSH